VLEAIAGKDKFDSTASDNLPDSYSKFPLSARKPRLAYFKEALLHRGWILKWQAPKRVHP
jgi:hypothetical protein